MSAATAYKPVPSATKTEAEPDSLPHLGQYNSLIHVRPRTLDRTVVDTLLLVATDVLMVLAWTGTLVYASLLWSVRNKFIDEISFSATELIKAATT
jgi:hypothetical protein